MSAQTNNELKYPGPRFLRKALRHVRHQRSFTLQVPSRPCRERLLRLLPLLEDAAYQLSLRDMAACFIGLFQFMPIYFTAKGSGYNVQHDAIGVMRVMFIHEADIKPITPPVA